MSNLFFTKDHEWVRVEDGFAVVGITDHAQDKLGDVVFVEAAKTGTKVGRGDQVAVVESVKAASDVYAPLSGEIVDSNHALDDDPSLVNTSAQGDGWFFKITISDARQLDDLMDEAAYGAFVAGDQA